MGILEVRNLRAGYGSGDVVRDIDISLEKGEFACILGPNGSGKTTFLNCINGVYIPEKGTITKFEIA